MQVESFSDNIYFFLLSSLNFLLSSYSVLISAIEISLLIEKNIYLKSGFISSPYSDLLPIVYYFFP